MCSESENILPAAFYDRPTLEVLRDIIGKLIVYELPEGRLSARIVEAEAYIGQNDPACHAARGITPRNAVMFGPPGVSYVYFVYGMYHCLNFVTEPEGHAAAILLRAAEPVEGVEIMMRNSPGIASARLLSGPGKFCRSFGITRDHNGQSLTKPPLYLLDRPAAESELTYSGRIGIKQGIELLWRCYDANSKAISKK